MAEGSLQARACVPLGGKAHGWRTPTLVHLVLIRIAEPHNAPLALVPACHMLRAADLP